MINSCNLLEVVSTNISKQVIENSISRIDNFENFCNIKLISRDEQFDQIDEISVITVNTSTLSHIKQLIRTMHSAKYACIRFFEKRIFCTNFTDNFACH